MNRKLLAIYALIISLSTTSFLIHHFGQLEKLPPGILSSQIYPNLRSVNTFFTDLKYKVRGPQAPKNPNIVIVEIGPEELDKYGRWPWTRSLISYTIDKIFSLGAKTVGLDIFFPEAELALPENLLREFEKRKLTKLISELDPDQILENTVTHYNKNLVLGWTTEAACFPRIDGETDCPVSNPAAIATLSKDLENTKFGMVQAAKFPVASAALFSAPTIVTTLPRFQRAARHSGFVNTIRDKDGRQRRTAIAMLVGGIPYPSMPLEVARVAKNEILKIQIDEKGRLTETGFFKSKTTLQASPSGIVELNVRGGGRTFPYVSVSEIFSEADEIKKEGTQRSLATLSKKELFKDAAVILGVTALGVGDVVPNPFDHQVPGVEMQATALDNILANDFLSTDALHQKNKLILISLLLLMTLGLFSITYFTKEREAIPILLLYSSCFLIVWLIDFKFLFPAGVNLSTSFLYLEGGMLFITTLIAKYLMEEQNKKFVKNAFTKYVSSAVVDNIMKDPKALQLGGEKRAVTVIFTDIRNFTTFSETMDPKDLSHFLNEYFALMTQVLFKYGGTLDKFIGDAIMAFFGAPLEIKTHGKNACLAAQEMVHALEAKKDYFQNKYKVTVEMGVGINTGFASVGNMGTEVAFQYTALGDQVNLASRMESATKQYGVSILTTHFTLEQIIQSGEPLPQYRIIDIVKVKGKEDAVQFIEIAPKEWPEEALLLFEQARELYRNRQWDDAITLFKKASPYFSKKESQLDGPCSLFIERATAYKITPPPSDWDGAYTLSSK